MAEAPQSDGSNAQSLALFLFFSYCIRAQRLSRPFCLMLAAVKRKSVLGCCPGFHYYRRELDAMPDPAAMRARRGAHWTFNAPAFAAAMRRARFPCSSLNDPYACTLVLPCTLSCARLMRREARIVEGVPGTDQAEHQVVCAGLRCIGLHPTLRCIVQRAAD